MQNKVLKTAALLVFLSGMFIMSSCMNFRKSDKKTLKHFDKKEMPVNIHRITKDEREFRFIETGRTDDDCPLVLFVHGAPGASDAYFDFLEDEELRSKAKLVAVDRPGYGYSNYGKSETDIATQAGCLKAVLQQYNNKSVVLVGHSYGGPIVARCAMAYPGRIKALLMVAPVNDPESEKVFWFAHFGRWKATRWMLSKAFRMAADEKFSHIAELEKMLPGWEKINMPVVHIHGKKDHTASFDNIAFSKKHIATDLLRTVELKKGNHLLIYNQVDLVKKELMALLED